MVGVDNIKRDMRQGLYTMKFISMRIILFAVMVAFMSCAPTLPSNFISAGAYDRSIKEYRDPVTLRTIYSVQLGSESEERIAWGPRFTCKMEVLKSVLDDQEEYALRFVLRSSPEEWPIQDTAYLFIDKHKFPLQLTHVNPRNTAQISGTAMYGYVSISTSERQVFRIEAPIDNDVFSTMKQISSVSVVFHSGQIPITFRLDEVNFAKLRALVSTRAQG
jgi:hypothetical protein